MAQIRVLQIVESTTAGVKSHVLSLVRHMDRSRFAVSVACPRVRTDAYGDVSFIEDVKACGVPYHIVDLHRTIRPVRDLRTAIRLCQIIQRNEVQIVHTHSSKAGLLGRLAAVAAGVPGVLYTPNGFAFCGQRGPRRWLYIWAERLAARWTDIIICSSDGEKDLALREKIAQPERLTVVQNAIDPQQFVAWTGLSNKSTSEPIIVGTVSRLVKDKGLRTLLHVAAALSKSDRVPRFIVVGDGELRSELESLAHNLGIAEHVDFVGYQADVRPIIAEFDIFVLPTRHEAGIPFAVMEAMAMEKPVVTTDAQGLERLQGSDAGRLVSVDDIDGFVQAIQDLWHSPMERRRLGQAGRALVEAEYTIADKVRCIEGLYETLLSNDTSSVVVV